MVPYYNALRSPRCELWMICDCMYIKARVIGCCSFSNACNFPKCTSFMIFKNCGRMNTVRHIRHGHGQHMLLQEIVYITIHLCNTLQSWIFKQVLTVHWMHLSFYLSTDFIIEPVAVSAHSLYSHATRLIKSASSVPDSIMEYRRV